MQSVVRIAEGYIYNRAGPEHIPRIHGIETLCFSTPWSEDSFRREFEGGLARYFIAIRLSPEGRETELVAGFCGYWKVLDEAHITNVAVHPGHRNIGVGAGLLDAMIGDMKLNGSKAATLEVSVDNFGAIRLYERFGFERAGIRKNYYENPGKDAIIMWKRNLQPVGNCQNIMNLL